MQTKINEALKFFGKKELGFTVYYSNDIDTFLKDKSEFIPLKILSADIRAIKDISEMPIEGGKVVNENVMVRGREVDIRILLNDNLGTLILGSLASFLTKPELADRLKLFNTLVDESYFIKVQTLTTRITNVQLISYDYQENIQGKDKYLLVNLKCKQMLTFGVKKESEDIKGGSVLVVNNAGFNKLVSRY